MALTPGTRLGPYEILAAIGSGGMGEVYRARDTRLDRTVAIKVLPASVASDPDSRQRFEREARAVAALNHPHICALYDVGEAPNPESRVPNPVPLQYLVMEYLEGETLAERLARAPVAATSESASREAVASGGGAPRVVRRSPLPLDQVLRYAIEVADAAMLGERAGQLLADQATLARMSQAALAFSRAHRGATARNLAICERLLSPH